MMLSEICQTQKEKILYACTYMSYLEYRNKIEVARAWGTMNDCLIRK